MDIHTRVNYISCACNNVPHCLSWGRNGLICYGACSSVIIADSKFTEECGAVVQKLHGHSGRVNSVRWIKGINDQNDETELFTTSSDKTAIIWKKQDGCYSFQKVAMLQGHSDAVTVGDGLYMASGGHVGNQQTLIVTSSSDSTIKIWLRDSKNDEISCLQTISLQRGFALDVKLHYMPIAESTVLIWGGEDCKIHIHVLENHEFVQKILLTGHEDWIRSVDITVTDDYDFMIASCAQDNMIRIWKLTKEDHEVSNTENLIPDDIIKEIKLKYNSFKVTDNETGKCYNVRVCLDSVLAGHENWIYGLHWHPKIVIDGKLRQPLKLLSASMDKTMIMWAPEDDSGIWVERVRVGDIGGNNLGFYGCTFSSNGSSILAYNFQGAFHLWHFNNGHVNPGVIFGGHFKPVEDVDWEPDGEFLITVSLDQTARLHAPWVAARKKITWHELARPQIHGYDMTCISIVNRYKFVSGADEKITRAFEAPQKFIENFSRLCAINVDKALQEISNERVPEGASVPALGLSNKAIFKGDNSLPEERHPTDMYPESFFKPVSLIEPATEDVLLQNTLWPEVHKLYGHGYEVFCVASNKSGTLLATACKASRAEDTAILLWDTATWTQVGSLIGHTLTVTKMEFSPCGHYLLSVSRDRTWSLFKKSTDSVTDQSGTSFQLSTKSPKRGSHTRIIWACAWSHDSKYFITGSRDKKVIIWGNKEDIGNEWFSCGPHIELNSAVTAVDFAHEFIWKKYFVGIGLESGYINLYSWALQNIDDSNSGNWSLCATLDNVKAHELSVTQLRFRPKFGCAGEKEDDETGVVNLQMASCGADHLTRVTTIIIKSQ